MRYQTWTLADSNRERAADLKASRISPLVAKVLAARGFRTAEEAAEFLSRDTECMEDPLQLRDMDLAVARIRSAMAADEKIAVYGDYDVDGITATCMLTSFLRKAGARCIYYIPDRIEEGYGLNEEALGRLRQEGVGLVLTVDCGITAHEAVDYAQNLGIDVVITDHHACQDQLPNAVAVVNPHRKDAPAAFADLAGVGVALKLLLALEGMENRERILEQYGDLAALGTVADVVPVVGENRAIVSRGLEQIRRQPRLGLRALLREANLESRPITAVSVGFALAPRINAAGRMGKAWIAAELLLTEDPERAEALASELCVLNRERQAIEQRIFQESVDLVKNQAPEPSAIVLAGDDWHQGVMGIVASRLSERFYCPAFMICTSGERGKGSCRSWGGFNVYAALEHCAAHLESYGGHELAAGFTILRSDIDAFRAAMEAYASSIKVPGAEPDLSIDAEADASELTLENVEALDILQPHGMGNPRPLFLLRAAEVISCSNVGNDKHLKIRVSVNGRSFGCIFFSATAEEAGLCAGDLIDLAFFPQVNEFRGTRTVQLLLTDLRPAADGARWALFDKYREGAPLSAEEARMLLPDREDFETVWRYLRSRSGQDGMEDGISALHREISAVSGRILSPSRMMICLNIFEELGLLTLGRNGSRLRIALCPDGRKVDLEQSEILASLRKAN